MAKQYIFRLKIPMSHTNPMHILNAINKLMKYLFGLFIDNSFALDYVVE